MVTNCHRKAGGSIDVFREHAPYNWRVSSRLEHTLGTRERSDAAPLDNALAAFAYAWQHARWNRSQVPAAPAGDAAAISELLLKKYPASTGER